MPKPAYYAVRKGRNGPAIYTSWDEVSKQVTGYPRAEHKKFSTMDAAQKYLHNASSEPIPHQIEISSTAESKSKAPMKKTTKRNRDSFHSIDSTVNTRSDSQERVVYCDGACSGNGRKSFQSQAGIGVFWSKKPESEKYEDLEEKLPGPPTNNRAELYAIIRVLETDPQPQLPLVIKTDSSYSIKCIENYSSSWRRNGWRKADGSEIKNLIMIRYILYLIEKHTGKIKFIHVKGHAGIEGNEKADRLANQGAKKPGISQKYYEEQLSNWENILVPERPKKRRALLKSDEYEARIPADNLECDFDLGPDDLFTAEELQRIAEGDESS